MGGDSRLPSTSSYPTLVHRPVGQKVWSIYKDRLRQFTDGGQYSGQNLVAYDRSPLTFPRLPPSLFEYIPAKLR